ncbi:signaling mucin MSB2-like [Haliotis rubra]|uniref:signaling mucin MSB2-like n=1 Tax=Haliotis rubra TaxID=36100 RepID=UPI001EE51EB9|nr:signaling mucin MSB2-like [Haliotis rubra]
MEPPDPRDKFYQLLEIDKSKAGKNHQEKRYIDKELYDKTIQAVESRKYERCPTGDAHFKDWAKGFSVKSGLDGVKVLLSNPDKLIEKRRKQEIQRRNRQRRRTESEQEEEDLDNGRKRPKKETKELPVLIKENYFDEIFKCHQEAKHSKEGTWRLVKDRWCMVTKQIITRFCQTCLTCNITQKKRTFQDPSTSDCSAAKRACAPTVADTEASWSSFSSSQTDETLPVISPEVISGWNQYTPRTSEVLPEFLETFTGHSQNLPSDLQRVDLQTLDSMSATSSSFGHPSLSAPSFSVSPSYRDTRGTQMHQRVSCSSVDSSGSSSSFYHQETHGFLVQNSPIPSSMIQTTANPNLTRSRSQGTKTSQGLSTHFGQLETCESTVRNPVESTNVGFSSPLMTAVPGLGRDANVRSHVPTLTFPSEAESMVLLASSPTLTASSSMTQRWVASIQSDMTDMSTAALPLQGEMRSRELMQLVDSSSLSSSSCQRLDPPTPHTMGMSTMILPSQDKNASKELIPTGPVMRATSTETQGWVDPTQTQTALIPQIPQTGAMSHRLPNATMPQAFTSAPGPGVLIPQMPHTRAMSHRLPNATIPQAFTSAPGPEVYSLQEEDGQTIPSVGQTLSKSAVFNNSSTPPSTSSQSSLGSYPTQTGIDVISRSESPKTHEGQAPSYGMDHWNFPLSSYLPPFESPSAFATPFTHHQVQTFHTLTVPSNVSSDHAYISMFNQPRPGLMSLASRPAHMSDQSLLHFYGQRQMSNNPRPGQVSKSPRQGQIFKSSRKGQISNSPQPSPMSHCHRQGQISDSIATLNTHKLPLKQIFVQNKHIFLHIAIPRHHLRRHTNSLCLALKKCISHFIRPENLVLESQGFQP